MAGLDDARRMAPGSGAMRGLDGRSQFGPAARRSAGPTAPGTPAARGGRPSGRRIGPADVAMFTYDLSMLLGAGLPLVQSLEVLADQATEARLRDVVRGLAEEICQGRRFSDALGAYPDLFPPLYRGIVTNGETSGRLDQALERLAAYLEREIEFRKKVRDLLIYPAMVLAMASVVLAIFLIYIIPAFERVYRRAGSSLPLLTRLLVAWSHGARLALPVAVAAGGALLFPEARRWVLQRFGSVAQRAMFALPHAGALAHIALLGRFAHSMAMMLRSGVPLLSALDVAAAVGGPPAFESMIERLKQSVIQGRRLSDAMRATGWFTPMFLRMVSVGEETGRLDLMVERTSVILDREFDVRMRRFLTVLEPILILLVGGVVAVVLMALYLPMFGLARGLVR